MQDTHNATKAAFAHNEENAPEVVATPEVMNAPEAVIIHHENNDPELAVAPGTYRNASPYREQPVSEYSQQTTAYDPLQPNSPQVDSGSTSAPLEKKERKTCGLKRRTFVILAIFALISVAAGIGGGVGGAMAASRGRPPSTNPSMNSADLDSLLCEKNNKTTKSLESGQQYQYLCGNGYSYRDFNKIATEKAENFTACVERCVDNNSRPGAQRCKSAAFALCKC